MQITCPICNSMYNVKLPHIPPGKKAIARCKKCGEKFSILPESEQQTVIIEKTPPAPQTVIESAPAPEPEIPHQEEDFQFITDESDDSAFQDYAGFWKRFAASMIDGVALMIAGGIVGGIFGFFYALLTGSANGVEGFGQILGALVGWLYFALLESSPRQATLGKMALGIKVIDYSGNGVSFWRATLRHFAKFISLITFAIGYLAVAFTKKKQGFHDMLAGCLVVNSR